MCRLFGLVASKSVNVAFPILEAPASLLQQTVRDVRGRPNPHGWGIGYYEGDKAIIHKRPENGSKSPEFQRIVRSVYSHMFVAHLRLKTIGAVNMANTQPYKRGEWILAHSGGIGAAWHGKIKKEVGEVGTNNIHGHTSGELLLAWLYQRASHLSGKSQETIIINTLQELCVQPQGISSANFVLATGDQLYAFRFAPLKARAHELYFLEQFPAPHSSIMPETLSTPQIPVIGSTQVLVASQTVTSSTEDWQLINNACLLIIDRYMNVHLHCLE